MDGILHELAHIPSYLCDTHRSRAAVDDVIGHTDACVLQHDHVHVDDTLRRALVAETARPGFASKPQRPKLHPSLAPNPTQTTSTNHNYDITNPYLVITDMSL